MIVFFVFSLLTILTWNSFVLGQVSVCANITTPFDATTNSSITITSTLSSGNYTMLAINFGDGSIEYSANYQPNTNSYFNSIDHTYTVPQVYNVTIKAYNDDGSCNITINETMTVEDMIFNFNASYGLYGFLNEVTVIELTTVTGSMVTYYADWGDQTSNTFVDAVQYSNVAPYLANHTYNQTGPYLPDFLAINLVSSAYVMNNSTSLTVYVKVKNLTLTGNNSLLWLPGFGTWTVSPGLNQLIPLPNITCNWTIGNGLANYNNFVPLLDNNQLHQINYTFQRKDCGMQTISVNCSNPASFVYNSMQVNVILDDVIIQDLALVSPNETKIYWNTTVTFSLNITRFGTGTCFEWVMGDNSGHFFYQGPSGSCNGVIGSSNPIYQPVVAPYNTISLSYWYSTFGVYNVTVRGFNRVNNETLWNVANILEWPCVKPNVTIESIYTNLASPFTIRVPQGFTIIANVTVNCMKNEGLTRRWQLFNATQLASNPQVAPLNSSGDSDRWVSPPYFQQAGQYVVRLNASMYNHYFNMTSYIVVVDCYVTIHQTPLQVGVSVGSFVTIPFNQTLTMDAFNLTYDPDIPNPTDKTGITWKWMCKRNQESWTYPMNVMPYRPYYNGNNGKGGCFGDGPGLLSFTVPTFTMNTSYFQEMINYTIELQVSKDDRSASYNLTVFVVTTDPPVLNITCQSNCGVRLITKYMLILRSTCLQNCYNDVGMLSLWWVLYVGGTSPTTTFNQYPNLVSATVNGLTNSFSLTIQNQTFTPGVYYKLVLYGCTPYSANGSITYLFQANIPPRGGTCSASPVNGTAGLTSYTVSCINWIAMDGSTSELSYTYYMGPRNSNGTTWMTIMYHGIASSTGNVFLPIGNSGDSYWNLIIPDIFDTLGDYTQSSGLQLQIFPPIQTIQQFLSSSINSVQNDAIFTGNPSIVCTNILSIVSALNAESVNNGNSGSGNNGNIGSDYSGNSDISGNSGSGNSGSGNSGSGNSGSSNSGSSSYGNYGNSGSSGAGDDSANDYVEGPGYVLPISPALSSMEETLRQALLLGLGSSVAVNSPAMIIQMGSVVQMITQQPSVITSSGLNSVSTIFNNMLSEFTQSRDDCPQEVQEMGATALASVTYNIARCANFITKSSSGGTAQQNNEINAAVKSAVTSVISTLDYFGSNKQVGDPPTILNVPHQLVMTVDRHMATTYANSTVSSSLGSVEMLQLQSSDSCLQRETVQSATNLFTWDLSSSSVTTPISYVNFKSCSGGSTRRKRSSTELTIPAVLQTSFQTTVNYGTFINYNTSDIYGMINLVYNLSHPGVDPALLMITPVMNNRNDTLIVYVKANERPTPDDFQWKLMMYNGTSNYTLYLTTSQTFNVTQLYVGVQSTAGCFPSNTTLNATVCNKKVVIELEYFIFFQELSCHIWMDDTQQWVLGPCQPTTVSPRHATFHANLLGGFGGGFVTPLNTIDFNTLFDNIGQKLIDSVSVWATIIAIFVLYVPFAVWARRLDKKDAMKWDILPLIDNYVDDEFNYEIHVHNGFARNSGTRSRVYFRVYGSESETGVRKMSDGYRQNFIRGHVSSFAMKVPDYLGTPLKFEIWHDNSGGKKAGWFLGKIVLVDVKTNDWYMFMCDNWLAVDKDFGEIRRCLSVSHSFVSTDTSVLMRKHISQKIFEDHLWLSVGYRAKKSLFTRAQRLGACMATLFLAMITNCMFYKDADETAPSQAINIGPITITGTQIYNSIMSTLIVFPLVLAITLLFSKSKRKEDSGGQQGYQTVTSIGIGQLPSWCTYLGWILVFLCVAVSAIFTIFYSMQWGKVKSQDWVQSFFLSFIESAILIQPLKVVLVAILMAFILKKDPDVTEYEKQLGQMSTVGMHDQETLGMPSHHLENVVSSDEIVAAREKQETDNKMKDMIREILFYLIFLFFILLVVNGQQDNWSYQQNSNLAYMLTYNSLINITIVDDGFYAYARQFLLPTLYWTNYYNGSPVGPYEQNYMSDMFSWRIGPPLLRQLRVKQEPCQYQPSTVRGYHCTNSYSRSNEDQAVYEPSWIPVRNTSYMLSYKEDLSDLQMAFVYSTEAELNGSAYIGQIATYSGGGYVANLGTTFTSASQMIDDLENSRWIDSYTRAIFIQFNTFNPGSTLANLAIVLFEYPTDGDMLWSVRMDVVQLYRYTGANGVVALLSEILCALFVTVITILELRRICRDGMVYWKSFWNCLQLTSLAMFYIAVVLYTIRCLWTVTVVDDLMNYPGALVSFTPILTYNDVYISLMSLVAFCTQIRLLHILRYNKTIAYLGLTLSRSAWSLVSFGFLTSIIFFAFTTGAYLMFSQLQPYSSMTTCAGTLLLSFLGRFNFEQLVSYYGNAAGYYLLIYLLLMFVLVTNLLISMLCEFLEEIAKDKALQNKDFQVIDHFLDTVKCFIVGKDGQKKPETSKSKNSFRNVHDLAKRISYLDDVTDTMINNFWSLEKTDVDLLYAVMNNSTKSK